MSRPWRFNEHCCLIAAICLAVLCGGSCTRKCRSGTTLRDGVCVAATGTEQSPQVGDGTVTTADGLSVAGQTAAAVGVQEGSSGISGAAASMPASVMGAGVGGTDGSSTSSAAPPIAGSGQVGAASNPSDPANPSAGEQAGSQPNDESMSRCPDGRSPETEVCDGTDNDCDNTVDEDLTMECGPSMMGECRKGMQLCAAGAWGECDGAIEPQEELCDPNMLDENCDGQTNEGCACVEGETVACGKNVGICRQGEQLCVDGTLGSCVGSTEPEAREVCDGSVDEDCDDRVDEGCACTNGEREPCLSAGGCTQGERTCADGRWGTCAGSQRCTGERVCDTRASQCVDCLDGDTRPCGDNDNPPCKMGTQHCSNHRWESSCQGEVLPERQDVCNGVDDDCNGRRDDGCGGGQSCMEFGGDTLCAEAAPANIQRLCRNCIKEGNVVKCEGCNGNTSATQYEGTCSRTLTACGGKLVCVPSSYSTASSGELQLCTNVRLSSDLCTLAADCKLSDMQTNTIPSSIEVRTCTDASGNYTGLVNCGGYLRCTSSC
jgi:hypothetical protein